MSLFSIKSIKDSAIVGDCYLPFDFNKITRLQNSGWNHTYTDADAPYSPSNVDSVMKHVERLAKAKKSNNSIKIEFTQNDIAIDRCVAKKSISAGDLYKPARYALFGDTMRDFDLDCAHQSMMLSALVENGTDVQTEYPALHNYVNNKTAERERLASALFGDASPESIEKAKQIYMRLTFYGSVKKAYTDYNIEHQHDTQLLLYSNEIRTFAEHIEEANAIHVKSEKTKAKAENTRLVNRAKKQGYSDDEIKQMGIACKNYKAGVLTLWGRNAERRIMESVIQWSMDNKLIKNRQFDNPKDGVMIRNIDVNNYLKEHPDFDICQQFSAIAKEKTGFTVSFSEKDMKTEHDKFWQNIEQLEIAQQASCEPEPESVKKVFNKSYMQQLYNYTEKKKYFERFFACIEYPVPRVMRLHTYKQISPDRKEAPRTIRNHSMLSFRELTEAHGNIGSGLFTEQGTEKSFVTEWCKDPLRREHYTLDFVPYCGAFDHRRSTKDVYNTFKGFPEFLFQSMEYELEQADMLQSFFCLVLHLVGAKGYDKDTGLFPPIDELDEDDKQKFEHIIMLIAYKIQFPHIKLPYAILIKSIQGAGKNTFSDIIGRIFDIDHYICSSNIEDFTGTHAEGMMNKLFVVMNEIDMSQSGKVKNQMKSLISENTLRINAKCLRPFDTKNLALILCYSNEQCPIPLDITGSDRRWVIYNANSFVAKNWGEALWNELHQHWKTPEFLHSLFAWFMQLDCKNYNFKKAKYLNSQTDAYKQLKRYFIPAEIQFLCHYIENAHFHQDYNQQSDSSDAECNTDCDFINHPTFNKTIKIEARELHRQALDYYKDTQQAKAGEKKQATFTQSIEAHLDTMERVKIGKSSIKFQFKPVDVYKELVQKQWVEIDDTNADMTKLFNVQMKPKKMLGAGLFKTIGKK